MDKLIPLINEFQELLLKTNYTNKIQLPQIVVVGNQSSGKSSLLESIIKKDILPRGTGIVTRRPTIIQLYNTPKDTKEYCEFVHKKGEVYTDWEAVRRELESEMARVAGSNKGISSLPIVLRIYGPNVINLSLIDLPGLTKVPIGEQPQDIEEKIREIVKFYIQNPNTIILCVLPANVDLANSDALKISREVDPMGNRTIGVQTKMDLIDQTTAGIDIIEGKVYPLDLGYHGVVLRSQSDLQRGRTQQDTQECERKYFDNHFSYKAIKEKLGVENLIKNLNSILTVRIKKYQPSVHAKQVNQIQQKEDELRELGPYCINELDTTNKGALMLNIINKFCVSFSDIINGRNAISSRGELFGGARINYIFNDIFIKAIYQLDPFEIMTDNDIRIAIRNANGQSPSQTVSESAFEILVREHISRLEDPSLDCAHLVHEELKRIVANIKVPELMRFEMLKYNIVNIMEKMLKKYKDPTDNMIKNIIGIELGHINTRHPDFIGGTKEYMMTAKENDSNTEEGNLNKNNKQDQGSITNGNLRGTQRNKIFDKTLCSSNGDPMRESARNSDILISKEPQEKQEKNQYGSQRQTSIAFSYGDTNMENDNLNTIHTILDPVPEKVMITSELSKREKNEIQLIKRMIQSYYDVIRKTISDYIPKTVITMFVKLAVSCSEKELVQNLYNDQKLNELLIENTVVAKKREETKQAIESLKKCKSVINEFEQKY